jgi:ketosteroid isomerase-like protein
MKPILPLLLLLAAIPCARAGDHERYCAELAQTEKNFCAQVATIGLDDAFLANMADDCFNPGRLSLTRAEYEKQVMAARAKATTPYKPGPDADFQLVWTPTKIDVSRDGTLGYTWGRYDFTSHGKDGKATVDTAVYITIWKRDPAGTWKMVYDGGPELPTNSPAVKAFLAKLVVPPPAKT